MTSSGGSSPTARSRPLLTTTRAVLFDADHTLLDTDRAERSALRAALADRGLRYSPAVLAAYRAINETLWERYRRCEIDPPTLARERFTQLLARLGEDPGRASDLGAAYLARFSLRGDLLPWCRRTLARLGRRFRLGLVTNGLDAVQRSRIRAAGLEDRFHVVVTSEGCGFAKPDPRILHLALRALELEPGEAVYVGDDLRTDGGAARAAGIPFCWFDRGFSVPGEAPPLRVAALRELPATLGI